MGDRYVVIFQRHVELCKGHSGTGTFSMSAKDIGESSSHSGKWLDNLGGREVTGWVAFLGLLCDPTSVCGDGLCFLRLVLLGNACGRLLR